MATILEFPHPRLRTTHHNAMRPEAEIVIFPGVRIERAEFSLADRIGPARRRRNQKSETRKSEIRNSDPVASDF
jgi:hypothetical protein